LNSTGDFHPVHYVKDFSFQILDPPMSYNTFGLSVKGLHWLKDADLDVSQQIDSDSIVFLRLRSQHQRWKVTNVTANLETEQGSKV